MKKIIAGMLATVMFLASFNIIAFADTKPVAEPSKCYEDLIIKNSPSLHYDDTYYLEGNLANIKLGTPVDKQVMGYVTVSKELKNTDHDYKTESLIEITGDMITGLNTNEEGTQSVTINVANQKIEGIVTIVDKDVPVIGEGLFAEQTLSPIIIEQGTHPGIVSVTFQDESGAIRFYDIIENINVDYETLGESTINVDVRGISIPIKAAVCKFKYSLCSPWGYKEPIEFVYDGKSCDFETALKDMVFIRDYRFVNDKDYDLTRLVKSVRSEKSWFFKNDGTPIIDYAKTEPQLVTLNYKHNNQPVYAYVKVIQNNIEEGKTEVVDKVTKDDVDKTTNNVVIKSSTDKIILTKNALSSPKEFGSKGLTVKLNDSSVTYDVVALDTILADMSDSAEVKVELKKVAINKVGNKKQQVAIKNGNAVDVFEITLSISSDEGNKVIHDFKDGTATITIPYDAPKSNYKVYRVEEDGTVVEMKTSYNNGYLTWVTNGHSYYMVTDEKTNTNSPTTGDNNVPFVWLLLLITAIGGASVYSVINNRNWRS